MQVYDIHSDSGFCVGTTCLKRVASSSPKEAIQKYLNSQGIKQAVQIQENSSGKTAFMRTRCRIGSFVSYPSANPMKLVG